MEEEPPAGDGSYLYRQAKLAGAALFVLGAGSYPLAGFECPGVLGAATSIS